VAPVEGLQQFADLMAAEGVGTDAIRTMVVANPASLVSR
jgi:predicted metal-dependent phosphotriesterase family hydrolase